MFRVTPIADWPKTPFELFGHDRKKAERANWQFKTASKGYNGNKPSHYAISPTGHVFKWNNSMRHGNSDPWEWLGQWGTEWEEN